MSIRELTEEYRAGKRPSEATEAALEAITRSSLNAFLTVDADGARRDAAESDRRFAAGTPRALEGVPIGVKDLIATRGLKTTAGSKILADWVPPYDATVVERLRAAGAILVGKTNLDEFAMGSSNEHSAFGPVRNPVDETRVSGGSSGGSAAAVAAGLVFGSLGTDTGGSIRQPAALTGITGLKPTYGRVSRYGVVAYASSLDQVGPMGRTVADAAALLEVIAGHDPKESTSAERPVERWTDSIDRGVRGRTIGVPAEYFGEGVDPEIEASVRAGIARLEAAGAQVRPISLPHTKYALSTYYLIATAEASSNLARYDGIRYGHSAKEDDLRTLVVKSRHEGFGEEVQRRIILGTYVLSAGYYEAYYGRAQKVRTLIRRDFEAAFAECDLIATPTSPIPAFKLGEKLAAPLTMYKADVCTLAVNLAGVPAISVPCGKTGAGLPIGLQLIGRWFEEAALFQAGRVLEA